jgi:regulation of enolase protein 1 (concanavalin A-like superfamily)
MNARNFSIGDQSLMNIADPQVDRYRNTLTSLNTADLNGDHATDLIASNGAILFNIAAVANRPPTVNAGPDGVILNDHTVVLRPAASDPDEDMLTYEIRDETGFLVSTYPNACRPDLHDGANTFTVTVNDGHGHSASDAVVYTAVTIDEGVGQFADGRDIGHVAAAGGDAFDSATGTYTVRGSGSDIWGTADEFHYVWTQWDGNFEITARVDSVQNVNAWTKAGIMIRQNLNAGSAHASLFATPGKGVAFQRRPVENGVSVHTAGPNTTSPVWLKLQRSGDVITAYYRKTTTDVWITIGQETLTGLSRTPLVGLAVGSHVDGQVASATFSRVEIQGALSLTGHPVGTGSGSFTTDGVVYTVTGRGADIWGSADAFFYVSLRTSNSIAITARVRSISGSEAWTKAGVMIREDLTPGSRHAMAVVTPGKGVAMQYRAAPGAASLQAANVAGTAPAWVRLSVQNGDVTSSWSTDGEHWTALGSVHIPFAATELYVGLPVTSHNASVSASAVFDDVEVGSPF